ncbi:sensor histidine kinase [Thiofilum flexile]|uniref:sensor histidine kinase n=1 Tax=Thiofilum flexile TaxID=125627 RepID=UPI00039D28D0|nr:ATP-binding protein [Thiofilum flexile]
MKYPYSLQRALSRWIMLSTVLFALLGGTISGFNAYHEAREYQDMHLQQVGSLLEAGSVRPKKLPQNQVDQQDKHEDEILLVLQLDTAPLDYRELTEKLPDGLHTLNWQGREWRTLLVTHAPERFAVAQLTEIRNELALESTLQSVLPLLLLTPVLLLLVHGVIRYNLRPVTRLANKVDARHEQDLTPLEDSRIPQELMPFIRSLNHLLMRVGQSMAQQRRFVADAAHELRTPLTALSLMAENVARAPDLETVRERLQPLQTSQQRMQALVNQLLGLARLQGRKPVELKPTRLLACVQSVVADLYPLAESRQIDLGMNRQADLIVADDEGSLAQLIRNGLENALRYTPVGGRVDIELYQEGKCAVLQICDTGFGIPETELERVFEPFHRAAVHSESGSGLGLTISREVAQRLGGQVWLQNQPKGGLCFHYQQPLLEEPS